MVYGDTDYFPEETAKVEEAYRQELKERAKQAGGLIPGEDGWEDEEYEEYEEGEEEEWDEDGWDEDENEMRKDRSGSVPSGRRGGMEPDSRAARRDAYRRAARSVGVAADGGGSSGRAAARRGRGLAPPPPPGRLHGAATPRDEPPRSAPCPRHSATPLVEAVEADAVRSWRTNAAVAVDATAGAASAENARVVRVNAATAPARARRCMCAERVMD